MRKRSKSRRQDLQEREKLADIFIFDDLILRRLSVVDQWNFAGIRGYVGADALMVHAIEADSTLDVFQTMLGRGGGDLVVFRRRDQIVGSSVEDDVGRESEIADRIVLPVIAETTFVVLRVRWRWSARHELWRRQVVVPENEHSSANRRKTLNSQQLTSSLAQTSRRDSGDSFR
jgi:hypothetical protein